MANSTIHIALGFHDRTGEYARHAGATLASVFANTTQSVTAHILHDETLTKENHSKLQQLGDGFGQSIYFYPARLADYSDKKHPVSMEKGKVYRLLLPDLLTVEKIIYLDCDVIVKLDIEELWNVPMAEHPVAAARDQGIAFWPDEVRSSIQSHQIDIDCYFNSGIMIMNFEQIRKQYHLLDEWIHFVQQFPQLYFVDQNFLNKLFQTRCRWLESKYNRLAGHNHCSPDLLETTPAIWHFTGRKPWNRYLSPVDLLYWRYLALTPWGQNAPEEVFRVLSRSLETEINQIKNSSSWRLTQPLRWIAQQFRGQ